MRARRTKLQAKDWQAYDDIEMQYQALIGLQIQIDNDKTKPKSERKSVTKRIESRKQELRDRMDAMAADIESRRKDCSAWMMVTLCLADLLCDCADEFGTAFNNACGFDAGNGMVEETKDINTHIKAAYDHLQELIRAVDVMGDPDIQDKQSWAFSDLSDAFHARMMPVVEKMKEEMKKNEQFKKYL